MRKTKKDLELEIKELKEIDERCSDLDREAGELKEENKTLREEIKNSIIKDNNFLRGMVLHLTSKPVTHLIKPGEKVREWKSAKHITTKRISDQVEYDRGMY